MSELEHPSQVFAHIIPNWFAGVMGTGIVANAAATLPWRPGLLRDCAVAVWVFAALALVALSVAFGLHWARHQDQARRYAADPIMVQFYGAPPMAILTVGSGTLLLGRDVVGLHAAVVVDCVFWAAGTLTGLVASALVPYLMITRHDHDRAMALPAWLMPVVPPMVSASAGALLVPHIPAGQLRLTMIDACYAMFGLSLVIGLITSGLIYSRLVHTGMPAVQAVPTIWIMLGLVGQSVTAANLLAASAYGEPLLAPFATGLRVVGIVYGLAMTGLGALMFVLATALTVHAGRRGLIFSLTWWSFTFPIGTCVTGATALGTAMGSAAVDGLADGLYAILLGAWATVGLHTLRGSLTGRLLLAAPGGSTPPPARRIQPGDPVPQFGEGGGGPVLGAKD